MDTTIIINHVILVVSVMSVMWVISVFKKDASIADPCWAMLFLLVTCSAILQTQWTPGKILLVSCVGLWSIRLSLYLLIRNLGEAEEDYRYQAFRKQFGPERYWWVSFFQVFMLQSSFALVIAAPLHLAGSAPAEDPIVWNDLLGLALFAIGFYFEAVGDAQLKAFKSDPNSAGKVLETGLWRYTRHPNYFGETTMMWGFWVMALDQPYGLASIFAPLFITFLLMRVSGVPMLEYKLKKSRPGYAEYVARTSSFFPWKPKEL